MSAHTEAKTIIAAQPRTVFGKQVQAIRKLGFVPANIYGKDFESKAISMNAVEFLTTYKKAGETTVVYVEVEGKTIPTLITDIQLHPVKRYIIHVDLRKVDLKKKIEAEVPVKLIGESIAVDQKNGVLISQLDTITIESLPTNIPHEIEIDISALKEIGDQITVGSIPKSDTYEIMDEPERVIVSVTEHVEEVIEVQTTTEAPEILTEKAPEGEEAPVSTPDKGKDTDK